MNSIKYILWSLSLLLAVSCYEDKGNYDYHPINELIIKGIEEHYDIERQDTLKIQVSLENSLSGGQNLLYAWYFNQNKIANTRDLNYVITEKAKKYSARFEVTDPQNDSVRFFSDFEVVVHSPYSEGLMLLSDCGDHPELSFCSTLNNSKEKILHEVFNLENGKPLMGKALKIEQPLSYYYNGQLFIHTTKVSYQLDPVLCKLIKSYDKNSFTERDTEYDMVYCTFEGVVEDFGVAIGKNGCLYPKLGRQDRYVAKSLNPIHVSGSEEMISYELSPLALSSRDATLGYDNISGCFLYFRGSYSIPSDDEYQYDQVTVSQTEIGLPWIFWGMNMDENFTSLFYDKTDGRAVLVRNHNEMGKITGQDSLVILQNHHLCPESKIVLNSANNLLYYSDGKNKIYLLNLTDPDRKFYSMDFPCSLPDNGKITMLKVTSDYRNLWVGIESGRKEKYKGDIYKVSMSDGSIIRCYKGMGGIPVDMIEKRAVDFDQDEVY